MLTNNQTANSIISKNNSNNRKYSPVSTSSCFELYVDSSSDRLLYFADRQQLLNCLNCLDSMEQVYSDNFSADYSHRFDSSFFGIDTSFYKLMDSVGYYDYSHLVDFEDNFSFSSYRSVFQEEVDQYLETVDTNISENYPNSIVNDDTYSTLLNVDGEIIVNDTAFIHTANATYHLSNTNYLFLDSVLNGLIDEDHPSVVHKSTSHCYETCNEFMGEKFDFKWTPPSAPDFRIILTVSHSMDEAHPICVWKSQSEIFLHIKPMNKTVKATAHLTLKNTGFGRKYRRRFHQCAHKQISIAGLKPVYEKHKVKLVRRFIRNRVRHDNDKAWSEHSFGQPSNPNYKWPFTCDL